jgi:hypothetical protein
MRRTLIFVQAVVALGSIAAGSPLAQRSPAALTVDGARLAVNGSPKFLLFVSYFDGLRATDANLRSDFAYFSSIGVDGVRVFPNWWHYGCPGSALRAASDDALFTASGPIRETTWQRFLTLLNDASEHGVLVDASFSRETITGNAAGVTIPAYTAQVREVARRLAGAHPHVMFDLQNEYENNHMTAADVAAIAAAVRSEDRPGSPPRILMASTGGGSQRLSAQTARTANLSLAAVHEPRVPTWYLPAAAAAAVAETVAAMGRPPRPVYFQEPTPFSDFPGCDIQLNDEAPTHARQAAAAAKASGAAAWTFHTRIPFALHDGSYVAKLRNRGSERAELEALAKAVDAVEWGTPPEPR